MNYLKKEFKRVRPLLGTFVRIDTSEDISNEVSAAFSNIEKMQNIFNFHDPKSELSEFNNGTLKSPCPLFLELLKLSKYLTEISEGYFNPQKINGSFDFGGLAKGFIVDQAAQNILTKTPTASGCINAGGDLRFFNQPEKEIHLRLGPIKKPLVQKIKLSKNGLATSSVQACFEPQSRTHYRLELRNNLDSLSTVSVQADQAAVADALTKIVLFAPPAIVEKCCLFFNANAMVFDKLGHLQEMFGIQ